MFVREIPGKDDLYSLKIWAWFKVTFFKLFIVKEGFFRCK